VSEAKTIRRLRMALVGVSMLCALLVLAVAGVVYYWKTYLLEPRSDPFRRGPFITRLSETGATLRWQVDGDRPVELRAIGQDGSTATAHGGTFTGLHPGTRYAWMASIDGATRASGSFRTAPSSPRAQVTFGVIGDYASGNDHEYAVGRMLAAQRPDFLLTVGDNSYLFGASWMLDRNIFEPLRPVMREAPLLATLGDHDLFWRGGDDVEKALDLPGTDGRYTVSYGPVFVVLLGFDPPASAIRWAAHQLARSTAPFEFLVVHHPLQPGDSLVAVARRAGVAAVFAGHLLRYERRRYTFIDQRGRVLDRVSS
jgi:Calcineurin-like phosphoesterase